MGVIFRATARLVKLNHLAQPLVFGHYAWLKDWEKQQVEEAGTGIFVAPRMGLSAKHVSKGFEKLDPQFDGLRRRMGPLTDQYKTWVVETQFSGLIYQAPDRHMPTEEDLLYWQTDTDSQSFDTDITVLEISPVSEAAKKSEPNLSYLEWQLFPPDRGSKVDVFGFPGADIRVEADYSSPVGPRSFHVQHIHLRSEQAKVIKVCDVLDQHGLTEFPGFIIDQELDHGFSGGPVFYNDMLVGIFSGANNYVASLWPLAIHEYRDRLKAMHRFEDLFETGVIKAVDWEQVKGRVLRLPCEKALAGSDIERRCEKMHVVLTK